MVTRYTNHFHSQGQKRISDQTCPNCHCFLEVCNAFALRGASAVPPNHRLAAGERTMIINDLGVRMLITRTNYLVKK
jgi:hypothetical protein